MSRRFALIAAAFCLLTNLALADMEFNGSSTYVSEASGVPLNTGEGAEMSVSLWVYYTNASQNGGLVMEEPTNGKWILFMQGGNLLSRAGAGGDISIPAPSANQWHHIAAIYRNYVSNVHYGQNYLYVDGVLAGSCDASANCLAQYVSSSGQIAIGALNDISNYYFSGKISDVRIYNRAIVPGTFTGLNTFVRGSEQEVISLAQSRGRLIDTDGLVGWWKLDDGSDGATAGGATVSDSSGGKRTATANNSPTWRASTFINYP